MKKISSKFYLTGQINPGDLAGYQAAGIKTIINNRPDDEEPGQVSSQTMADAARELGMDYHYLPMANGQPLPETLVDDFKAVMDNTDEPVLAHCRSGMRSSFIWALGQIPTGSISVDDAIEKVQAVGIPLGNARAVLESVKS